jgi:hypothetical protein
MKKTICISILIFCFQIVFGCDCGWNGGLFKNTLKNKLTVHGKVKKHLTFTEVYGDTIATSAQIEIIKSIKGKIDKEVITVWGDRGADCRPYLIDFNIGSEWIFSLHEIENHEFGISSCGEHITPVKEGETWGFLFYNDRCSLKEHLKITVDSFMYAVNNPSQFLMPTKSCWIKDKGKDVYIEVNQMPKLSEDKSIQDLVKEKFVIKKDISEDEKSISLSFDITIDEKGNIVDIIYRKFPYSLKRKRKYYKRRIQKIIKNSSPWIPGNHNGKNLKVRKRVNIKIEDLLEK